MRVFCSCAAAAVCLALLTLSVENARGDIWAASMFVPWKMELNSRWTEPFKEAEFGNGAEEGEPVTPSSGSICRPAGNVEGGAFSSEEIGPSWVLKWTNWYSFEGNDRPIVVRVDGLGPFGAVLYQTPDLPAVGNAVGCSRGVGVGPPRIEADTQAGHRYLVQVGDWRYWGGEPLVGVNYTLSVANAASNKDRAHALDLAFGVPAQFGNFGGLLESPAPSCSPGARTYLGGRSVWADVDMPAPGELHVTLKQEDSSSESPVIIALYPEGAATPTACSVGPFNPALATTDLNARLAPGRYSLQLMTAVKSGQDPATSAEELWEVTADISPSLDTDGDGHLRPSDCRDDNAVIHPGALDLPDNGIDEDCDGQDARRDSDNDGVPDYRDRCPRKSNAGVDSNDDGCRDPWQLQLTAQVRLTLSRGRLHLASLIVKTDPGARVVLECEKDICEGEAKRMRGSRAQFGGTFAHHIPDGANITLAATEARYIGVIKRYRLSTAGMRLLRQWCTAPGRPGKKTPCG